MVRLRVLPDVPRHPYHRTIYDAIGTRIAEQAHEGGLLKRQSPERLLGMLEPADIFHLHWPEHLAAGLSAHQSFIEALRLSRVQVVWTQHNLMPHDKDEDLRAVYRAWAGAADGVIHHSEWGRARICAEYPFKSDAVHRVIPHPHFGPEQLEEHDRRSLELELGLTPGRLRIGIVGAPRREKQVAMAISAFARCERQDLELAVFSLGPEDPLPNHRQVIAERYRQVPRETYDSACGSWISC
jgi:hypothetical protein